MTITALATPELPPLPVLDEAELFFFLESAPYYEDRQALVDLAMARAAGEKLGYRAGACFEWETVYIEGLQADQVTLTLRDGFDVTELERLQFIAIETDEIRRLIEADMCIAHTEALLERANALASAWPWGECAP